MISTLLDFSFALEMVPHVNKPKSCLITSAGLAIPQLCVLYHNLLVGHTLLFAQTALNWSVWIVQSQTAQIVFHVDLTPPLSAVHVFATLTAGHGTLPFQHQLLVNGTMSPVPWQSAGTTVRPKSSVACLKNVRLAHFALNVWWVFTWTLPHQQPTKTVSSAQQSVTVCNALVRLPVRFVFRGIMLIQGLVRYAILSCPTVSPAQIV